MGAGRFRSRRQLFRYFFLFLIDEGFSTIFFLFDSIQSHLSVTLSTAPANFNRPAMVELAKPPQIDRLFIDSTPPAPFPALRQEASVSCHIAHA
jgi:hypothetical protein